MTETKFKAKKGTVEVTCTQYKENGKHIIKCTRTAKWAKDSLITKDEYPDEASANRDYQILVRVLENSERYTKI